MYHLHNPNMLGAIAKDGQATLWWMPTSFEKLSNIIYIRDYVIVTRLGHFFERICQLMT
jgi:hypothetical protein